MRLVADQQQIVRIAFLAQRFGDLHAGLASAYNKDGCLGIHQILRSRSALPVWKSYRKAIEPRFDDQLTRQPAVGAPLRCHIGQHKHLII